MQAAGPLDMHVPCRRRCEGAGATNNLEVQKSGAKDSVQGSACLKRSILVGRVTDVRSVTYQLLRMRYLRLGPIIILSGNASD